MENDNVPSCIDTVKELHRTIVSLRKALEQSKSEISQLKQRAWPVESVQECLNILTIENHVLKTHLLTKQNVSCHGKEILKKSKRNVAIETTHVSHLDNKTFHPVKCKEEVNYTTKLNDTKESFKSDSKVANLNFLKDLSTQIPNVKINNIPLEEKTSHNKVLRFSDEKSIKSDNSTNKETGIKYSPKNLPENEKVVADIKENDVEDEHFYLLVDNISPQKVSTSLEDLSIISKSKKRHNLKNKFLAVSKTISFSNITDLRKIIKLNDKKIEITTTVNTAKHKMTENNNKVLENTKIDKSVENQPEELFKQSETAISVHEERPSNLEEVLENNENIQVDSNCEILESSASKNSKISPSKVEEILRDNQTLLNLSNTSELKFSQNNNDDDVSLTENLASFKSNPEINSRELTEDENLFENSSSTQNTIKEQPDKEPFTKNEDSDLFKEFDSLQNPSDQNEEVDDIELIFTTDETKESDFKEELVPIESSDGMQHLQCPVVGNDADHSLSFELSDRELDDEVFNEIVDGSKNLEENLHMFNSKSDTSINQDERSLKSCYSCQGSSFENRSFEKDESFDQFNEKIKIIETDISKCGIVESDLTVTRRNTCPNPIPYRPIIHREAVGKGLNIRKGRPILGQPCASRRDSGAQTDITALPNTFWRSESSLAHKVKAGENFATLPSKLPLPCSRIKLSEKTVEARRILLSDIGFTSMVPELSRSADHLCPETLQAPSSGHYGQFLRAPEIYSPNLMSQKFNWTTAASTPLEMSRSGSHSRYNSVYPLSPPIPSRRCSAPVSPSRRSYLKQSSKVRFANGSLPELRADWNSFGDSGDSTDSLVDEAEMFLRRSIDCLSGRRDYHRAKGIRRASAPEPCRDSIPLDWHPFLPRTPHDLRHEHWVKVIVPGEGKVRGGRVRYVGPVAGFTDQYVGVQLSTPDGHSDGVFHNRRYFSCEPHHAVFVPFKKVIMGWKP